MDANITFKQAGSPILLSLDNKITIGKRLCKHDRREIVCHLGVVTNEPRHDKINKVTVRPARTQIRLGIRPV